MSEIKISDILDEVVSILEFSKPAVHRLKILKNDHNFNFVLMYLKKIITSIRHLTDVTDFFTSDLIKCNDKFENIYSNLNIHIEIILSLKSINIIELSKSTQKSDFFISHLNIINKYFNDIIIISREPQYWSLYGFDLLKDNVKIIGSTIKDNFHNNNYMYLLKCKVEEIVSNIVNPSIYEKNYLNSILFSLSSINFLDIFKGFNSKLNEEIDYRVKKIINKYMIELDETFLNAWKHLDHNIYSKENLLILKQNFIIKNKQYCKPILNGLKEYFISTKYINAIKDKIKISFNLFSKFKSIETKAQIVDKYYPSYFKDLNLKYKKRDGSLNQISLDKNNNLITINNISDHSVHNTFRNNKDPGIIYTNWIDDSERIIFRKINFYQSYRSFIFDYSNIPITIFWTRKNNFYVTSKFYINFYITIIKLIKNNKISNIPDEMIELILTFISINDMCKYHEYKNGELFK